jgi:hypothetical protein
VVVEATRPGPRPTLTLDPPAQLAGTAPLTVGGTVRRDSGEAAPVLTVQLREPGLAGSLATTRATVTGREEDRPWSAELVPRRAAGTRTGAVAAWTTDADGTVTALVAAPTTP